MPVCIDARAAGLARAGLAADGARMARREALVVSDKSDLSGRDFDGFPTIVERPSRHDRHHVSGWWYEAWRLCQLMHLAIAV